MAGLPMWLAATAVALATAGSGADSEQLIVEVDARGPGDLRTLRELDLDVLPDHPVPGPVQVRVGPPGRAQLDVAGLPYRVVVPDLERVAAREQARLNHRSLHAPAPADWYAEFRSHDEIEVRLTDIASRFPDQVERIEAGASVEGRAIGGLHISTRPDPDRPTLAINGGQHAREWLGIMVAMCVAETTISDYGIDPVATAILDRVDLVVVPLVNPDGYVYSWEHERFWRKNRTEGTGVDLNRNWEVGWGHPDGSSDDPESNSYHGAGPFSEPETRALRDVMAAVPNLVGHIDYHTYGQYVLYPWGYIVDPSSQDTGFSDLTQTVADAMAVQHGTEYRPLQGAHWYPAAGVAPDWSYGQLGAWSVTIELRPLEPPGEFTTGFDAPPEDIVPTCGEALDGVRRMVDWVLDEAPDGGEPEPPTDLGVPPEPPDDPDPDPSDSDGTQPEPPPGGKPAPDGPTPGPNPGGDAYGDPPASVGCGCRTGPGGATTLVSLLCLTAPWTLRRRRWK